MPNSALSDLLTEMDDLSRRQAAISVKIVTLSATALLNAIVDDVTVPLDGVVIRYETAEEADGSTPYPIPVLTAADPADQPAADAAADRLSVEIVGWEEMTAFTDGLTGVTPPAKLYGSVHDLQGIASYSTDADDSASAHERTDVTAAPAVVWVLTIEHRFGTLTDAFTSHEAAHAALVEFVHEWWDDTHLADGPPDDPTEAIETYFETVRDEWYEIAETTLATPPADPGTAHAPAPATPPTGPAVPTLTGKARRNAITDLKALLGVSHQAATNILSGDLTAAPTDARGKLDALLSGYGPDGVTAASVEAALRLKSAPETKWATASDGQLLVASTAGHTVRAAEDNWATAKVTNDRGHTDAPTGLPRMGGTPGRAATAITALLAAVLPTTLVDTWSGAFRDGYTPDDVAALAADLAPLDLSWRPVCIWDLHDEYGFGGDSEIVAVHDDDTITDLPDDLAGLLYTATFCQGDNGPLVTLATGPRRNDLTMTALHHLAVHNVSRTPSSA